MKLSPARAYEFVKAMSQACGPYPNLRSLRQEMLRLAARELGPERYAAECKALRDWAGPGTLVERQAREELLRIAAANDPAAATELATLKAEDEATAATISSIFDDAGNRMNAGDIAGAAAVLDKGLANVPTEATEARWLSLMRSPLMSRVESLPLWDVLVQRAPEGEVLDMSFTLLRAMRFDAAAMRTLVKLSSRHALDRDRSTDLGEFVIRSVATSENPTLQL